MNNAISRKAPRSGIPRSGTLVNSISRQALVNSELDIWIRENSTYLTNMKYEAIRGMVHSVCGKLGDSTPKMYQKVRRAIIYYFFD